MKQILYYNCGKVKSIRSIIYTHMKTEAIVKRLTEDRVQLVYIRNSACGNCRNRASCMDADSREENIELDRALLKNIPVTCGDKVILKVHSELSPIILILIMYGIPVFSIAGGIIAGSVYTDNEIIQLLVGIGCLFSGFFLAKYMQRCIMRKNYINYSIERLDESC
ncbi:MAG: SoxR reducing system RseC family protein [Candidatus Muiribacteriaceae bacterium]